jgi:hypothetical protein
MRPPEPIIELDPNATLFNWVIVARGPSGLFDAAKGLIIASGGKIAYQKLSGYRFRVEELRPPTEHQRTDEGAEV